MHVEKKEVTQVGIQLSMSVEDYEDFRYLVREASDDALTYDERDRLRTYFAQMPMPVQL